MPFFTTDNENIENIETTYIKNIIKNK